MAENEDADDLAIIFRSAGKPVRMSSAAKWRRAITLGDLTRETPVEVEAAGRSLGVRPAGEVPALARLFDALSPLAPGAEPEPEPQDAPAIPRDVPAAEVEPAPAITQAAAPPPPPPVQPQTAPVEPARPAEQKSGVVGCLVTIAIVIVVCVVAARSCGRHHPATPSVDAQTVYVTRQVNLRPDPSSANAPTGALDRGAALTGVWNDADKTWFKITSGDHQGSFVWGMDLDDRQRPDLAATVGGAQVTLRPVTEYREPETGSPSERDVPEGESLVVAGRLASGWWEVLNKGKTASTIAGVGYVPAEAFDAPAAAPVVATPGALTGALSVNGCNQSDRPISVAFTYLPAGGGQLWKYKGWTRLASGECKLLFLTDTADFYLRAETDDDGDRRVWGGDINRCAAYPGPYEYDLELSGTCPADTTPAGFYRRTPDNARGSFTENFR